MKNFHYVRQYDNLINPEKLEVLSDYSETIQFKPKWKASSNNKMDYGHWNHSISSIPKEPLAYTKSDCYQTTEFRNRKQVCDVWEDICIKVGPRRLIRSYFNLYTFGTEGYIHRDDPDVTESILKNKFPLVQETFLIYLNKKWDVNWAGETVIFDENDDALYTTLPKYGRMVNFNGYLKHVGRSVSRVCPENRVIFAFKAIREVVDEERAIQFIRNLGSNIPHSESTYFNHCYNVYLKLKGMGLEETICLAGLFHSIYSTEYFKTPFVVTRETVKSYIGEYAEELVYSFCTLGNRIEKIIENKSFNKVKNYHLACIEYANLLEQHSRIGGDNSARRIDLLNKVIESHKV